MHSLGLKWTGEKGERERGDRKKGEREREYEDVQRSGFKPDIGKLERGGRFVYTGSLNRPPNTLLSTSKLLESNYKMYGSKINKYLGNI